MEGEAAERTLPRGKGAVRDYAQTSCLWRPYLPESSSVLANVRVVSVAGTVLSTVVVTTVLLSRQKALSCTCCYKKKKKGCVCV